MSRNKGTFNFPANFEVLAKAPLDARMRVSIYEDLVDPSIWNKTGSGSWLFDGAIVVVASDPSSGIYWCKDSANYTDYASWELAGTSGGDVSIGVVNVGDGSANIFAGYDASGNIQLRTLDASGVILISQIGDTIIIDVSLGDIENRLDIIDASIERIDSVLISLDSSIQIIDASIERIDGLLDTIDASIERIDASLGDYVRKDGDTMTGDLIVPGISITNDLSVGGGLSVVGDVEISGDLTVDGSVTYVNTTVLDVSTNFIRLNTGLVGTPPSWLQSGIVVERGSEDPYIFTFDETDDTFRIGIVGSPDASGIYLDSSTQAVATREDSPVINAVATWNDVLNRFDTSTGLTFGENGLYVDGSLKVSSLAGTGFRQLIVSDDGTIDSSLVSYDGIYVKEVSIGSTLIWDVDGYLQVDPSIILRIDGLDASIQRIDGELSQVDASIQRIDGELSQVDSSIQRIDSELSQVDASIQRIDGSINDLYSKNLGLKNIGTGDASIYYGIDGSSYSFREIKAGSSNVLLDVSDNIIIIDVSLAATPSGAGIDGGVWITDITPTSGGNVGDKVTSSDGNVLDSCLTDVSALTVHVLALPGHTNYKPIVTINDVSVSLSEGANQPLWDGTYNIQYDFADASITVHHEDGAQWSTIVDADTPAVILSATFINGYPGSQTELKAGDTFDVSIMTDVSIVSVQVDDYGAFTNGTFVVNGNDVGFTGTIANRGTSVQNLGMRIRVVKATGSTSGNYLSESQGSVDGKDLVKLNNIFPTATWGNITYPGGQSAIKLGETASVINTLANYNTVLYSSPNGELGIPAPTTPLTPLIVSYSTGTYNISTNNLRISANRAANNATTTNNTVVWIANTPTTLSVSNPAARLRSGGNDGTPAQSHVITINASQRLLSAPDLTKDTGGTWLGVGFTWGPTAISFTRSLQVTDAMAKGTYNWVAISGTNLAGIVTSSNIGATQYILGGFVVRDVSIAAFGWQNTINVEVSDYSKLSSTGSGQALAWTVKSLATRSTIGDVTRPQADVWSASATFTNPTTISILDKSATDSASAASSFTIQEAP